jgi:methyl-accepting chemotaxis protein
MLIGLFMVPIGLLGFYFVQQSSKDIAFAKAERNGVAYASALTDTFFALQRIAAGLPSDVNLAEQRTLLESVGPQYNEAMKTTDTFKEVVEHLQHLADDQNEWAKSGMPSAEVQDELLKDSAMARLLLSRIGDGSNLILDPDLDSYYLMDLVILRLPDLAEALRDLKIAKAKTEAAIASGAMAGPDLLMAVGTARERVKAVIASAERAIETCQTGVLKTDYAATVAALKSQFTSFDKEAVNAAAVAVNGSFNAASLLRLSNESDTLLTALPDFWKTTAAALDGRLVWRIDGFNNKLFIALGISITAILAALALAVVFSRSILNGINGLSNAINKAAAGDLNEETPYTGDKTEIGQIARSVEAFRLATIDKLNGENAKARDAALIAKQREAARAIGDELRATISDAIANMNALSEAMSHGTVELSQSAQNSLAEMDKAARGIEGTTAALTSVSSTITEFAMSINEITGQAERYVDVAQEASQGSQMVTVALKDLNDATARIGSMVDTISGIAGQTNLLALNATIEAARAGDAGRGFAVVAQEVKALATTTAAATVDITAQVRAIETVAESFTETLGSINSSIQSLSEISTAIATAISQQKSASNELDSVVQSIAREADLVNDAVVNVVGLARGTGGQATDLDSLAQQLAMQSIALKDQADGVIFKLSAA